jgi:hypothetical protein
VSKPRYTKTTASDLPLERPPTREAIRLTSFKDTIALLVQTKPSQIELIRQTRELALKSTRRPLTDQEQGVYRALRDELRHRAGELHATKFQA